MKDTKIEWCDHTFNPWIGCTKVSPGCLHCYAENRDQRFSGGVHWGKGAPRQLTSDANWRQPVKWNRQDAQKKIKAIEKKRNALWMQVKALVDPIEKETGLSWFRPEAQLPNSINDRTQFEKAGGEPAIHFGNYNGLIVRLAKATEEEGIEILKSMGINWTSGK